MNATKKPKPLTVVEIIEKDEDRVLVAAVRGGKRKTFHLRRDAMGRVDQLVRLVEAGETVKVDLGETR